MLQNRALVLASLVVMTGAVAACGGTPPGSLRAQPAASQSPPGAARPAPSTVPDDGRPARIAINHDDFKARHVGHTADGSQFFLTTPFVPGEDDRRDFVALYLFDADGRFRTARIDEIEMDGPAVSAAGEKVYEDRLAELGAVRFGRIEVEPFEVRRFGLTFGLVVTPPDEGGQVEWVTVEPGDYMAFHPPWDLGVYDT